MFEVQHQQFKSARWWFARRKQIDTSPQYQRKGNLWKLEDRQSLIDTMINGYDMPKLYFADFTTIKSKLNEAGLRYAVVDGKQRLEAIFKFLANEMPLSDHFVLEEDSSIELAGLYYRDISEISTELAERVEEFPLPVVHVITDDSARIRELFLRLNKGLVLTGPEKRNAMIGGAPEVISEIAAHDFFSSSTSYKSDRGQDLNNAAKILAFELNNNLTDTKRKYLDKIVSDYRDNVDSLEYSKMKVYQNLDKLSLVFGKKDKILRSAGSIPAFYWFVRDVELDRIRFIRPFLESFYRYIGNEDNNIEVFRDISVDEYKRALRSVNDRWSHSLRVEILEEAFHKWLRSNDTKVSS
ncbi:DUF262 domain-containing protein [Stappia sp. GBMRC 2046]|uniref:DUF262 domain-containing protein n=1 Tax=Stappia sediminis TaxID=2692190 RepID=A0A7X3LUE9_9HYPH|nr:DUF262 domain-containing protein [Stappia sediminis]MXN65289.1 DUF262 domain-containing protein [Stappia sediminis]